MIGAGVAGLSVARGLAGRRVDLLARGPLGQSGQQPVGAGRHRRRRGCRRLAGAPRARHARRGGGDRRRRGRGAPDARGPAAPRRARRARRALRPRRAGRASTWPARPRTRVPRVLHARDATGAEVVRALSRRFAAPSGTTVFEGARALELVTDRRRASRACSRDTRTARSVLHLRAGGGAGDRRHRPVCTRARRTRPRLAATAWRSPGAPARGSPTSSSCSSTRRRSTPAPTRCRCSPRRCAARARSWSTSGAAASWPTPARTPSCCRATSWPARSGRPSAPGAARSWTRARPWGRRFPERFPTVFEACRRHGHRPARRADPGRARGALPHGRRRRGPRRPHEPSPACGPRGEVACTGVARREPARQQLAPRRPGVRRARRRVGARGAAAAARPPSLARSERPTARRRRPGAGSGRGRAGGPAADVGERRPRAQPRRPARRRSPASTRSPSSGSHGPSRATWSPSPGSSRPPRSREPRAAARTSAPTTPPTDPAWRRRDPAVAERARHPARDASRGRARGRGGLRVSETPSLPAILYDDLVRRALAEDLGRAGDLTTDAIVPAELERPRGARGPRRRAASPASSPRSTRSGCSIPRAGPRSACRDGCDAESGRDGRPRERAAPARS